MGNPKFSIIIPVYNTKSFLPTCLESILDQDFEDFELWIVDDGSTDGSIEIINEYANKDKRIKTGFIKGSGPAEPRNYGLRRARGGYVLFVDSDDYLPNHALKILNKATNIYPEADFIRGNQRILIDGNREAESEFSVSRALYSNRILDGESFLINILQKDYAPIDSLFKRDFLIKHSIEFHEELTVLEDGPFISEICSKNPKCVYINEETYVYRLFNPNSVTNSPKNLNKSLSLIRGAQYYIKIANAFKDKGRHEMLERSSDHSVAGLYQACKHLNKNEAKIVFQELKKCHKKLEPSSSYNKFHILFSKVYNFSPLLAFYTLKFFIKLFKI